MKFDILKYAALVAKAIALTKKINDNRPDDVEEYTAAVLEIKALWDEASAMLKGSKVTPGDIQAVHARAQAMTWTEYDVAFNAPVPEDPGLIVRGFQSGDYVGQHWQTSQWKVQKTPFTDPQWNHLRRIGED